MKKCPNKAIELFIKQIRVYDEKIEIYLNYSINQPQTTEQASKKLSPKPTPPNAHSKVAQQEFTPNLMMCMW